MKIKKANSYAMHALMYMVRHMTQLPVTIHAISKAEQIPYRQLVGLFRLLSEAGIVKNGGAEQAGYMFAKQPSEITLLELFELIEGGPIFEGCFMDHCDCQATSKTCSIYAAWLQATESVSSKLAQTTIETAAWGHPDHRF
jgi:Rrf2 family protein